MAGVSVRPKLSWRVPVGSLVAASMAAALFIVSPAPALAQSLEMPPIATPFAVPDFHFSHPVRDAQYWWLEGEVARTYETFGRSLNTARRAIYPAPARPSTPAAPGSPAWLQARVAVEQAIRDRRPVSDAIAALDAFLTREGRQVSSAEAQYALDVRQVHQSALLATSDNLVDLLASLAGIRINQWPP